ncbi:MAG: glycerol-3-phosphate 1-O-acyltransferase PlsY [Acidobacteria bacterium]|nr:glycerol-3-phosphate 1-O-acyltransferase PlsY [Acidobacteriota bacterium]
MTVKLILTAAAYLLGCIPFGLVIYRIAEGKDIRQTGSGNIGATNVMRSGKKWQGILTLLLDGGKGALAVLLAKWVLDPADPDYWMWVSIAGFAVVFGHIFTVFLRFKGGKGVAAGCGAYLALMPLGTLTTLVVFVLAILVTRYVSLGSILATALFPLWGWLWGYGDGHMSVIWIGVCSAVLIVSMHHANIVRLLKGTENKLGHKRKPVDH